MLNNYENTKPVPTYTPNQFNNILQNQKPNTIIITTIDHTHHHYITPTLELKYDIITKKPLTINKHKLQHIIDTIKHSNQNIQIAFNYQYSPLTTTLHHIINDNTINHITSIHFK